MPHLVTPTTIHPKARIIILEGLAFGGHQVCGQLLAALTPEALAHGLVDVGAVRLALHAHDDVLQSPVLDLLGLDMRRRRRPGLELIDQSIL